MLIYFLKSWNLSKGIFNFQLLYRTPKMTFYVLNNNFSYTQLSFVVLHQKDFDHHDTDAYFLFLLQKDLYICPGPFFAFFFLLQKDFGMFHMLLFKAFLCFLIIFINHFYICIQKNYKKVLIVINYFYIYQKNICIGFKISF